MDKISGSFSVTLLCKNVVIKLLKVFKFAYFVNYSLPILCVPIKLYTKIVINYLASEINVTTWHIWGYYSEIIFPHNIVLVRFFH